MSKKLPIVLAGLILTVFSSAGLALTLNYYPWYNNPHSYSGVYGCTWRNTTNYGGSWGSQFNYVRVDSCPYSTMQVNHPAGSAHAQVVLN